MVHSFLWFNGGCKFCPNFKIGERGKLLFDKQQSLSFDVPLYKFRFNKKSNGTLKQVQRQTNQKCPAKIYQLLPNRDLLPFHKGLKVTLKQNGSQKELTRPKCMTKMGSKDV